MALSSVGVIVLIASEAKANSHIYRGFLYLCYESLALVIKREWRYGTGQSLRGANRKK
jgi:hypothetical protein